jgi:hypothetical protein
MGKQQMKTQFWYGNLEVKSYLKDKRVVRTTFKVAVQGRALVLTMMNRQVL